MIRERIEASLLEMKRLGFCVVEREFRPENAFAGVALRDDKQGQIYSFAGGVIGESAAKSNQLLYAKVGPGLLRLLALVSDELGQ